MTLKERIAELFDTYEVNLSVEEKKQEMAVAKLASGQEIMTDAEAFAEGVKVFVMNDENEQIPLPSGDYEMEDGKMLVVVDGVVESVGDAPAQEEEVEVEAAAEEPVAEEAVEEAKEEALTAEMVKSMIADAIAEIKQDFSSQIEAKEAKITALSQQAAEKGLSRAPKQMKTFTPVDMTDLSTEQRVRAITDQYLK